MKFRTDFVTNSSSSGFTVVKLAWKDGETIEQRFDEGSLAIEYQEEKGLSDDVFAVSSIAELCQWLQDFLEPNLAKKENDPFLKIAQRRWQTLLDGIQQKSEDIADLARISVGFGDYFWGKNMAEIPNEKGNDFDEEIEREYIIDFVEHKLAEEYY